MSENHTRLTPLPKTPGLDALIPPAVSPMDSLGLNGLLTVMDEFDAAVIELTDEQLATLGEMILAKVDGIHWYAEGGRARAEFLRTQAKAIADKAKAIDNAMDRLESYVLRCMQSRGLKSLAGNVFVAKVSDGRERVELIVPSCGPADACAFPDFVAQKFEWSKSALSDALKAGNAQAQTIAKLTRTPSITFKPKGVK